MTSGDAPGEDGDHRHDGDVEGRQQVDGQGLVAEDAEDHQRDHQHGGEDRTTDGDVVQIHRESNRGEFLILNFEFLIASHASTPSTQAVLPAIKN